MRRETLALRRSRRSPPRPPRPRGDRGVPHRVELRAGGRSLEPDGGGDDLSHQGAGGGQAAAGGDRRARPACRFGDRCRSEYSGAPLRPLAGAADRGAAGRAAVAGVGRDAHPGGAGAGPRPPAGAARRPRPRPDGDQRQPQRRGADRRSGGAPGPAGGRGRDGGGRRRAPGRAPFDPGGNRRGRAQGSTIREISRRASRGGSPFHGGRRMKHLNLGLSTRAALLLAALCLAAGPAIAASNAPDAPDDAAEVSLPAGALPTIPLSEIQRGQRGYGLSVFSGTEPERFDVEVIGVMRNVSPEVSYILARLTGKGLEKSGVAGGMSGSPVFLDGKLAGAVAFSWPFTNEAVAGITPIGSMRQLSGFRPIPVSPPPPEVKLSDILTNHIPQDLIATQFARLLPRFVDGAAPAVQWTATGFGERSTGMLRQVLGNVSSGGKAAPGTVPDDLKPGQAVNVVLVDGDFQLAANGTVTDRYGDQVLAFGHPFLGMGPVRVPMATAEVVTVLSSANSSFKIANTGRIVGAFEQDRKTGIQGRIGVEAPMVPMTVRVKAERPREYHMRLASLPEFMPLLVGSGVVAGLEAASYTTGSQSLDMTAHLRLSHYGDLEVRQSFDGNSAVSEASTFLLSVVSYLTQNSLEKVDVESVDVALAQADQPSAASLVGANASRTVVHPGDHITLNLELVPYRGERFRHTVPLDLPGDLPAGRYSLLVGDGASVDAARLSMQPSDPVTFPQALDLLRSFHSRRDLMVLGFYGGPGLSVAGEAMPRLPGSVRSLWGAAASGSAVALRAAIVQEKRETLAVPVQGVIRIDLEVRRREPVTGDDDGSDAAGSDVAPYSKGAP